MGRHLIGKEKLNQHPNKSIGVFSDAQGHFTERKLHVHRLTCETARLCQILQVAHYS